MELYNVVPSGQEIQVGGKVFPRSFSQEIVEVEQYEARRF